MAITAGVSVASLYYVQPILDEVSKSLHKSENEVGLLPALAQAGYGLGLFFITPYGDKMNRKKLILLMLLYWFWHYLEWLLFIIFMEYI